jgi:hypothetical protein
VYPKPEVRAALDRLALALAASERADAALAESARRLVAQPGDAARTAFARCEVRARRARLHVRLWTAKLDALREQVRDDQRRVPARFRRRREDPATMLDLVGHRDPEPDANPQGAALQQPAGGLRSGRPVA